MNVCAHFCAALNAICYHAVLRIKKSDNSFPGSELGSEPTRLLATPCPCLGMIFRIAILGKDFRIGTSAVPQLAFACHHANPTEPVLERDPLGLHFPAQVGNDQFVQFPELLHGHRFQVVVLHSVLTRAEPLWDDKNPIDFHPKYYLPELNTWTDAPILRLKWPDGLSLWPHHNAVLGSEFLERCGVTQRQSRQPRVGGFPPAGHQGGHAGGRESTHSMAPRRKPQARGQFFRARGPFHARPGRQTARSIKS